MLNFEFRTYKFAGYWYSPILKSPIPNFRQMDNEERSPEQTESESVEEIKAEDNDE